MNYVFHLAILLSVYTVLASAQHLVFGLGGALLVMQGALLAVGAYGAALAALAGIPVPAAILLGAFSALALGLPMGLPALRLRGDYLLVASLGICEIVRSIIHNADSITGGAAGLMNIPPLGVAGHALVGPRAVAPFAIGLAACVFLLFRRIEESPYGRLLRAVGEDPDAVRRIGKSVRRVRLTAIGVSSFWTGLMGGVWASYLRYVDPSSFTMWESVLVFAMVVLGGVGSRCGAVLGAAVLVVLPELLRFTGLPTGVAGPMRQIVFGVALIMILRLRPSGLLGSPSNVWRTS